MTATIEVRTGTRVWIDGTAWVVQELGPSSVLLAAGTTMRAIATHQFLAQARVMDEHDEQPSDTDLAAVVLGCLSKTEVAKLEQRAAHVREILADGESELLVDRYSRKASELGVSVRTLERWVTKYREAGVAGLANSRMLGRYSSGVDSRWDAACIRVLDCLTNDSTPTMNVVIARIARELAAEFGTGVVPLPSKATAYRRLAELSKGRHAFGSAKQRRSVAERPQGVFGRLRATRPGEYVVLDTTPLDVFAMEPVTLRWVPVELTVAMDLFTRCILGLRLTAVSTKSQDVANVLFQCVTVQHSPTSPGEPGEDWPMWPFHGVPRNLA